MNKELGKDKTDSATAIKGYINYREENRYRHKARVLISADGINRFNSILYIYVAEDTKHSFVLVEGSDEYSRNFCNEYTNEHQSFRNIGGTLLIQATDIWGNDIEIDISGV